MSLLLYAITSEGDSPGGEPRGVGGAAVQRIGGGRGLVALASEHDRVPELNEETLWSFEHVIESVMDGGAVLPVRFGALLASNVDVTRMLNTRDEELLDKLEHVRGAVELSVRGFWPEGSESVTPVAAGVAATGTEYMQARLAPQRRADALAQRIHGRLDDRARASRHRILSRASVPVTAAFLIDRGSEEEFVRAVTRLDEEIADAELVCTGPWPAYSFVGDSIHG